MLIRDLFEALVVVIINFKGDNIDEYDAIVSTHACLGYYSYTPKSLYFDMINRETPPPKPWI